MSDVLAFSCSVWRSPRHVVALGGVGISASGTNEEPLLGFDSPFVSSLRLLSAHPLRSINLSRVAEDSSSIARGAIAVADSVVSRS